MTIFQLNLFRPIRTIIRVLFHIMDGLQFQHTLFSNQFLYSISTNSSLQQNLFLLSRGSIQTFGYTWLYNELFAVVKNLRHALKVVVARKLYRANSWPMWTLKNVRWDYRIWMWIYRYKRRVTFGIRYIEENIPPCETEHY